MTTPEPCDLCARRVMHHPGTCTTPCIDGRPHDVRGYASGSGYWRGQCTRCHRTWEDDSSG